jgi:hypothetical protein
MIVSLRFFWTTAYQERKMLAAKARGIARRRQAIHETGQKGCLHDVPLRRGRRTFMHLRKSR